MPYIIRHSFAVVKSVKTRIFDKKNKHSAKNISEKNGTIVYNSINRGVMQHEKIAR